MKISVIIPAYNEARRIPATLDALQQFYSHHSEYSFETIIVNDGSTDETEAIIHAYKKHDPRIMLITLSRNYGKGHAVYTGMKKSTGDNILFMDADSSTPISELPKLLQWSTTHDIIIGSRHIEKNLTNIEAPFYRKIITFTGRHATNILFKLDISDTQCGFKLFNRTAITTLMPSLRTLGFCFDIELLFQAKKHSLSIMEVPVVWNHAHGSRFRPIRDTIISGKELLSLYWRG